MSVKNVAGDEFLGAGSQGTHTFAEECVCS